jgi:membrane-associated phospholipid phosphatase
LRSRTFLTVIIVTGSLIAGNRAQAQSRADPAPSSTIDAPAPDTAPAPAAAADPSAQPSGGLSSDIKQYFTAPLHWDARDWAWFGGALAAIAASHHFDSQVRTHFVGNLTPSQIQNLPSDDVQDILPTVGVLLATWGYASWTGSSAGHEEAWAMFEAAGLSTVTAYGLKYSLRRLGPDQTSDPDEWEKTGGKSFPSEHSTAAFAVGTVLAESGNDEYRWLRRLLGYGLGVATSYERLKHNTHWLSDTVAGAALGISSAHFVMNRTYASGVQSNFSLVPVAGGAMLTYNLTLP